MALIAKLQVQYAETVKQQRLEENRLRAQRERELVGKFVSLTGEQPQAMADEIIEHEGLRFRLNTKYNRLEVSADGKPWALVSSLNELAAIVHDLGLFR